MAKGLLAIRTMDTSDPSLLAVDARCWRSSAAPYLDLQLVAFPQDGVLRTKGGVSLEALLPDKGVDVVGGTCTSSARWPTARPARSCCARSPRECAALVEDMHCDESDDLLSRHIETLAFETQRLGLQDASPVRIAPPCTAWTTTT